MLLLIDKVDNDTFREIDINIPFEFDFINSAFVFITGKGFALVNTKYLAEMSNMGYREHFGCGIIMPEKMVAQLKFQHPYIEGKFIRKKYSDNLEREKYGLYSMTYKTMEGLKYSYGVELETSNGIIPEHILREMSVNSVRDGSLKDEDGIVWGAEIVTDVLIGDSGLRHLSKITSEISKRCKINEKAGIHFHVGQGEESNVFTKDTIVHLFHLCYLIQDEIQELLPPTRRHNEYCRNIENLRILLPDQSRKLSKEEYEQVINENYDNIVSYLAHQGNFNPKEHRRTHDHPKGFKCGYDHHVPRYCWINFIPTVFNTRKNGVLTVEFRSHSATLNFRKIRNWLLLCMAIVKFSESFKDQIVEGIRIEIIVRAVYPRNCNNLIAYLDDRRSKFSSCNCDPYIEEQNEYYVEPEEKLKLKEIICI